MLRTAQAELTVTQDHRIVVPDAPEGTKMASELNVDDEVYCCDRVQKLTKVQRFERVAELVEFRFSPDDPVETRLLPHWGILTKGSSSSRFGPDFDKEEDWVDLRTDDGFD